MLKHFGYHIKKWIEISSDLDTDCDLHAIFLDFNNILNCDLAYGFVRGSKMKLILSFKVQQCGRVSRRGPWRKKDMEQVTVATHAISLRLNFYLVQFLKKVTFVMPVHTKYLLAVLDEVTTAARKI